MMDKPGDGGGDGQSRRPRNLDALNPRCRQMLEDAGFVYDRGIEAWFNSKAGRAISFDRVAERTPEWLAEWLAHPLRARH